MNTLDMQDQTLETRTSKNTWQKNKKMLLLLVGTIISLVAISVVYIIIFPKL